MVWLEGADRATYHFPGSAIARGFGWFGQEAKGSDTHLQARQAFFVLMDVVAGDRS